MQAIKKKKEKTKQKKHIGRIVNGVCGNRRVLYVIICKYARDYGSNRDDGDRIMCRLASLTHVAVATIISYNKSDGLV